MFQVVSTVESEAATWRLWLYAAVTLAVGGAWMALEGWKRRLA